MDNTIKVALVDNHKLFRQSMAALLNRFGFTVHLECSNGKELTDKLDINDLPDVILMDTKMPEMDGFETTIWLKKKYPSIKVLAFSRDENDTAIIRMLESGANGYLLKSARPEEFHTAIYLVYNGGIYFKLLFSKMRSRRLKSPFQQGAQLTEKERQILQMFKEGKSNAEIATTMQLSPRTIEVIRKKLFDKNRDSE